MTAIVVAAIGAVPLLVGVIPQLVTPSLTTTYDCMETYEDVIEIYEKHRMIVTLPESHPEEQSCDTSGRFEELPQLEPLAPDSTD
ncbi:hypothetical protein D7D94_11330 [Microbacterium oryzae]|uniref:Uncharacterized protein n=1 Tax=Microbacterium oryzae TaxID=743009 RepID=A0A6I6E9B5_9MICO|nr:hypothetical protein D7D94_11330 [Microbacterium oryzae]